MTVSSTGKEDAAAATLKTNTKNTEDAAALGKATFQKHTILTLAIYVTGFLLKYLPKSSDMFNP